MTYTPPDITSLTPTPQQRECIERAVALIYTDKVIGGYLVMGRGAGKTTLRAMIAQAVLDDPRLDAAHETAFRPYTVSVRPEGNR